MMLATAKAELVLCSMQTRGLKAGQGRHTRAQLTFKSGSRWWWLYLLVTLRTEGTG